MDRPNAEAPSATEKGQDATSLAAANKRLRIVTRCGTLEEFLATFGAFADESSLFIVTNKPRPLGLKQPFIIQLREGETILRGDVEVVQSITDGKGPDGRNGMRLRLLQMDDATREVLRRLQEYSKAARSIAPPAIDDAPLSSAVPSDKRPAAGAADPRATAASKTVTSPVRSAVTKQPVEERAPGAAYQLPANPFEGITAEALESFIECTLYEEREAPAEADPASRTGASVILSASAAGPPAFGAIPPPPAALPPTFAPPPAPTFGAPPPPSPSHDSGQIRDAVLIAAAIQAASVPKLAPQRRPWIIGVGVTAIVSSIGSLALAYYFWGRQPPHPTSGSAQTPTALSPTGLPVPERTATAAPSAPAPSASAAPSAAPTGPPAARDCLINIRSYPLGAAIHWNGEDIGHTPLSDAAVPCGPAKVTFDLQGYEPGERSTQAVIGKSGGVFLRLVPIRVSLEISSTPPGAQIVVDGRAMGTTPTTLSLIGLRETTLMVKHPAYKPWMRTLTPEPPKITVHADLEHK